MRRRCRRKASPEELQDSCMIGWPDLSQQELDELATLKPCQLEALANVRRQCRRLHLLALPHLRLRVEKLGFSSKDLDDTLAWVRERAPVIIHLDLASTGRMLAKDSHYRNQFETLKSGGTLDKQKRILWENELFSNAYDSATAFERCKYGVVNVTNDPQGVRCCLQYGLSYLLLRGVRARTTFCSTDSAGMNVGDLATLDCCAHVFSKFSDTELKYVLKVGTLRIPGTDSQVLSSYKEAQIHGELRLTDHVELIMAHPSSRCETLNELAGQCQCPVVQIEGGIDIPALQPPPQALGVTRDDQSYHVTVRLPSVAFAPGEKIPVEIPGGQLLEIVVPAGASPGQQISIQVPSVVRHNAELPSFVRHSTELSERADVWEVEDDDGWKAFNPTTLRYIDDALSLGKRYTQYEAFGYQYELDFDVGVQKNLATGRKRMVRRRSLRSLEPTPSSPLTEI
eukprot:CAMPEP_0169242246 /NCGR_PEP_ID=MMETSP1016-20121227/32440_1 /TAXON_ID=342587 /ORGANISM="Karlodinium micrum, Strain CCMP2283" /LENGTH=454 /DNA_ID=CAMNT_0009322429 /DNA_START=952 /DNA_END=2316 /DNA_ORIENTATION=-